MAFDPQLSDGSVNDTLAAFLARFDSGYLRIYDGVKPANANTAIGAQVKLAELRFGSTAFGSPVAGFATANAITPDTDAAANGTASWFRIFKSDGTTVVMDGSVGTGFTDLTISNVSIAQHMTVTLSYFQVTMPEA